MLNAEQEDSYLDQAREAYYEKKYAKINKKKYKNVPKEIIIFSINDMWEGHK